MKTIFRFTNTALLLAAIFTLGTVAALAQDTLVQTPRGRRPLGDKIRALFADKTI